MDILAPSDLYLRFLGRDFPSNLLFLLFVTGEVVPVKYGLHDVKNG